MIFLGIALEFNLQETNFFFNSFDFCEACICHKFIAKCKSKAAKLQDMVLELWCNLEPARAHLNWKWKFIT